jgi:hypothetical protein
VCECASTRVARLVNYVRNLTVPLRIIKLPAIPKGICLLSLCVGLGVCAAEEN